VPQTPSSPIFGFANSVMTTRLLGFCVMFLFVSQSSYPQCSNKSWTVNLSSGYDFHPFGSPASPRDRLPDRWRTQQGLVFLSSKILAVYQVLNEPNIQPVLPRDASGGGGRYKLMIVFLLVGENGRKLRELKLVTDASSFSEIFSVQGGGFVIRTGNLLNLFSSNFEELKSTVLSIDHNSRNDTWLLASDPSNGVLIAKHEQDFGKEKTYNSVLYRVNLETMGLEKYDDLQAEQIAVRPSSVWTQRLPPSSLKKGEGAVSAILNGRYLAAEVRRGKHGEGKPERIVRYDLAHHEPVCAAPLTEFASFWPAIRLYAISSEGDLALIQSNRLTVWIR
jgi:hypothetical protein